MIPNKKPEIEIDLRFPLSGLNFSRYSFSDSSSFEDFRDRNNRLSPFHP